MPTEQHPPASAAPGTSSVPPGPPCICGKNPASAAPPEAEPSSSPAVRYAASSARTSRLADIFLELQEKGAANINLVTGTQFAPSIVRALDLAKPKLQIPVVFNCGGYEKLETIRDLADYVDIWLPDLKYMDSGLAKKYSAAPDYFEKASDAIKEMIRLTGGLSWNKRNPSMLDRGVIIRHMVLPGAKEDSIRLLHWIRENLPDHQYLISIMSQYTPFYRSTEYPEINRRITSYEYNKVVDTAIDLGLTEGFMQERSSAKEEYTPPFDCEGL